MEKPNKKTQGRGKLIHIRLSPRTHQKLKIQVAFQGTTLQAWVSRAIRKALRAKKPKAPKPISLKGIEIPQKPSEGKPK